MLWWIAFFNYADRQSIFSVFPFLQREFHLNDTQLGLLGSSFAWVYGLSAPLAGSVADRIRRKTAILSGLRIWSLVCMATALSRSFAQLLFFRAAEGLGETIYFPASMSLISDYHGKATRSRAMGTHQTSVYIGVIAGGFFAGTIGQRYGWRSSFVVFGGCGFVLSLVLSKFIVEPIRGGGRPCRPGSQRSRRRLLRGASRCASFSNWCAPRPRCCCPCGFHVRELHRNDLVYLDADTALPEVSFESCHGRAYRDALRAIDQHAGIAGWGMAGRHASQAHGRRKDPGAGDRHSV